MKKRDEVLLAILDKLVVPAKGEDRSLVEVVGELLKDGSKEEK